MGVKSRSDSQSRRVASSPVPQARVANTAVAVKAQPVERYSGAPTSKLSILGDALGKASPQFKAYIADRREKEGQDDLFEGQIQAKKDSIGKEVGEEIAFDSLHNEQTAAFQKGYMAMSGMLAGQRKANELQQLIQSEVYEKDGDFDAVVNGFLNENMQGLDDTDYSMSFLKEIAPAEDKARTAYIDYQKAVVDVEKQTGFSVMTGKVADSIAELTPEQQVELMAVTEDQGRVLGLDNATMNEIIVDRFIAIANDGNPEVLEFFKLKRKNGTAGLWDTPKWTTKLDNALDSAIAQQTRNLEAQQKASDKEVTANKKAKHGELLGQLMSGDDIFTPLQYAVNNGEIEPSAAQALFGIVRSISNDQESSIKEAAKGDREAKQNELSFKIQTGKLSLDDVLKLWGTAGQTLDTKQWQRLVTDAKALEDPNSIFNSKDYTSQAKFLSGILAPKKGPWGEPIDPEKQTIYEEALLEFSQQVRVLDAAGSANFDTINELSEKIRNKYEPRTRDLTKRYTSQLLFTTREQFDEAILNRSITIEQAEEQQRLYQLIGENSGKD